MFIQWAVFGRFSSGNFCRLDAVKYVTTCGEDNNDWRRLLAYNELHFLIIPLFFFSAAAQ